MPHDVCYTAPLQQPPEQHGQVRWAHVDLVSPVKESQGTTNLILLMTGMLTLVMSGIGYLKKSMEEFYKKIQSADILKNQ
jgi:hypothetical protein